MSSELDGDLGFVHEFDETVCILGTGELFTEVGETETGVNALLEDAAETDVTLENDDFFFGDPVVFRGKGCCHTGRAATDDDKVIIQNLSHDHFVLS